MQGAPATTRWVPDWREAGGGGSAGWGGGVGDPGLSVETEERWIFRGSGFEPTRIAVPDRCVKKPIKPSDRGPKRQRRATDIILILAIISSARSDHIKIREKR